MRINNNLMAMNTHRQLGINSANGAKSIEKLSSGYRINRAGDDAAGLAISEKMRSQVRGLNQASRNAQDGISLIQTAEGALNESQAILQRMRELSVQSANDTNVNADRSAIQNEIDQLGQEIDRIATTTEFNTQSLLKGDGKANLASSGVVANATLTAGTDVVKTQASYAIAITGGTVEEDDAFSVNLNGISVAFAAGSVGTAGTVSVSGATATVSIGGPSTVETAGVYGAQIAAGLQAAIDANSVLAGNFTASFSGATVTITAVAGGAFDGAAGNISTATETQDTNALFAGAGTAGVGTTTPATAASYSLDLSSYTTTASVDALIGKGFTVDGKAYEFYNANNGEYAGDAIGINVSDAYVTGATVEDALGSAIAAQLNSADGITVTADATANTVSITSDTTGASSAITFTDGSVKADFSATFQIGSNESQTMEVTIGDMRAKALGVDGVDISTSTAAQSAITTVDAALSKVSDERAKLGAFQNRLEHTIKNLDTSSENLQASESRIRDVDMAKEMMEFTKNNILQQAAQAMLAQANQAPQGVLQLLR